MPKPEEILVDAVALSAKRCKTPIKVNLRFATTKNFIGEKIDGYHLDDSRSICLLSRKAANALCKVQATLNEQGLGLYLYDAYRPTRAVTHFWNWSQNSQPPTENELQRKNKHYPLIPKDKFFELGYVSKTSSHCYGNTLDTEIIDLKTNKPLFMGARISYMGKISHSVATTDSIKNEWQELKKQNALDDVKKQWKRATGEIWQEYKEEEYLQIAMSNRKLLADVMIEHGFATYPYEWWHYAHKDKETDEPMDLEITAELRGMNVF